jgi:hypothetical protein
MEVESLSNADFLKKEDDPALKKQDGKGSKGVVDLKENAD